MTQRLYYDDPYLREFDASITGIDRRGDAPVVTLDRTAFYPTSGGQPFDTGMLGPWRVVDVIDQDDGSIGHVTARAPETQLPSVGDRVHGEIDWARRFDHMQQHTGQHVLSAAFERLFQVPTVSFHLGTDVSTIDVAREVTREETAAAEDAANQIVWEDRAIAIRYATAAEAARLPLRKEPAREGILRVIDVDRFDLSACGGTHVARTGGIGVIAVTAWERFKGGSRLEFVCGGRALSRFRVLRDTVASAVRLLSVAPRDLPEALDRLHTDARDQKRAITALHTELARLRAEELARAAENGLIVRSFDADAPALKAIAGAITARNGFLVVLVTARRPAQLVVARSADVDASAHEIVQRLVARFGGRGGGKPDLAQGGGLDAPPDAILAAAREAAGRPTDRP